MALYSILLTDRMVSVTHQRTADGTALLPNRTAIGLPWRRSVIATML